MTSTKSLPHHQWHHQNQTLDFLLPKYYEHDLTQEDHDINDSIQLPHISSFRSTNRPARDPELAMGDCDAMYAATLLNSEFVDWLQKDSLDNSCSSDSSNPTAQSASSLFCLPTIDRLRMLLGHISPDNLDSGRALLDSKGKKKA
ncbi:hypothetical protein PHYBLDRAFT_189478 [Phycomyces blakesleeanus NRRL 1555(-)]|uniref:Uncharacterized protein n=2 Tax=Phycomyces blakesleeanus TaxID=4837 RepID=A0A162T2V7_PHYB8|nr:hypothetical protein PHYBLDRAFT_189478 [Phycomyces blakesleeanus NRRL 1555(-)]OAD65832.1 hypothetical protein PHYBLDRAFT_189478 [Phycomyces blakesleeanus NRRL 1555(-)]|eukprot:XP_018283872.1 hypothetical protein PHYBLDRAFT_189478 [Phycomyces blakesleeanus NRRL 1555(-)]